MFPCRWKCWSFCLLSWWACLSVSQVHADVLHWQWIQGDVYEVVLRSGTDIRITAGENGLDYKNEIVVHGQWVVTEVNNSGIARLRWQVRRVQINPQGSDEQLRVDTESVAKTDEQKTMQATLRKLLRKRFELQVNQLARLMVVKELREDSAGKNKVISQPPPAGDQRQPLPELFDADGVSRAFQHIFIQFPLESIKAGESWNVTRISSRPTPRPSTVYNYLGFTGEGPQIAFTSKIALPRSDSAAVIQQQSLVGEIFVNADESCIEKAVVKLELDTVTDKGEQAVEVKHREVHTIELKKLLR